MDHVRDGYASTVTGMSPVEGTNKTAGSRDYEVLIHREGWADPVEAFLMFDANGAETLDPTLAVEFTPVWDEESIERLRVGDVLTMRVVINT